MTKDLLQTKKIKNFIKLLQKNNIDLSKITVEQAKGDLMDVYQENFQNYKPHKKQALFHKAGKKAKRRLFLAGNRTGKTLCASVEVSMHLTGIYSKWWRGYRYTYPIKVWVASDTAKATRDVLQEEKYLGKKGSKLGLIPEKLVLSKTKLNGIANAIDTAEIRHTTGGISTLSFKSFDLQSMICFFYSLLLLCLIQLCTSCI